MQSKSYGFIFFGGDNNMIVIQKVVLRLFTAELPAMSCNFIATWHI
jgi:hypothetical protein